MCNSSFKQVFDLNRGYLLIVIQPQDLTLKEHSIQKLFGTVQYYKENININLLKEKNKIDFYEDLDDFSATKIDEVITNLTTLSIQKV
ncbi:26395_t:CDS:2 [Gigaspora margarita]|uniref:26395_t:CDS:1 n=1 Tax=Gigaspora margarita TaxID=4874 RepID=A0ABN7VCT3_GIGMA|nr:26395_t:CDS:2 [Gigaspora margarita]